MTVKKLASAEGVPVYNCLALVAPARDGTVVRCRCGNLAGLSLEASTEREALQQLVQRFKAIVAEHLDQSTDIPWIDPPEPAADGESVRYLAVHL